MQDNQNIYMVKESRSEKLFWRIYRNIVIKNKIFQYIEDHNPQFKDNRKYYIGNKIKFQNIKSLDFMVKNSLFELIKDKVISNYEISINSNSILQLVKKCNNSSVLEVFFKSNLQFLNENYSDIDLLYLAICFGNSSLVLILFKLNYKISIYSILIALEYSPTSLIIRLLNQMFVQFNANINNSSDRINNGYGISINYEAHRLLKHLSKHLLGHLAKNKNIPYSFIVGFVNRIILLSKRYSFERYFIYNIWDFRLLVPKAENHQLLINESFITSKSTSSTGKEISNIIPNNSSISSYLFNLQRNLPKYIFTKLNTPLQYLEYYFNHDEIITPPDIGLVYIYTFSTFSANGLKYLIENININKNKNNNNNNNNSNNNNNDSISDYILFDIKKYFKRYSSNNSISFDRVIKFISNYCNQNQVEFNHWDIYFSYLSKNYPIEIFNVVFRNDQYQVTRNLDLDYKVIIDYSSINNLIINLNNPSIRSPVYSEEEQSINNSVPKQIMICYDSIIITSRRQVEFINENLSNYNFGYILIHPKIDSLEVAFSFDCLFTGINKELIYNWLYLKSIFIHQDINQIKKIENCLALSNSANVNPFIQQYKSNSFKNISSYLDKLIKDSVSKTIKKNNIISDEREYTPVPFSSNDIKYFSKSNFFKDYLNNTSSSLLKLMVKKSLKQLFQLNKDCEYKLSINKFEEIINHIGCNSRTNSTIFTGLLSYIYYNFSINELNQININAEYFQQELLELIFVLVFNKEIGKAVHCFKQIKSFNKLYISKIINYYVDYYIYKESLAIVNDDLNLELDNEIESKDIVELVQVMVVAIPNSKIYIFKPVFQHLFNYLCSSENSTIDILKQVYSLYKSNSISLIVGVYHILHVLNLKNNKLIYYFLNKPFNYDFDYHPSNNYNGNLGSSNIFNQTVNINKSKNLVLESEVKSITSYHNNLISFNLSIDSIFNLSFDHLCIICRNLVSELPQYTGVYENQEPLVHIDNDDEDSFEDNINNDILYFLTIHNYEYALKLINTNIEKVNENTIYCLISIHPTDIVSKIIITQKNIDYVIMACIKYRRLDVINSLFKFEKSYDYLVNSIDFDKILKKYRKVPKYKNYYNDITQMVKVLVIKLSNELLFQLFYWSFSSLNKYIFSIVTERIKQLNPSTTELVSKIGLKIIIQINFSNQSMLKSFIKCFRKQFGDVWDGKIKSIMRKNNMRIKNIF